MQARHRNYLLKDSKRLHAHIQVIPTGSVQVEIIEKRKHHASEFEYLKFERKGTITKLIGQNIGKTGKPVKWQVPLEHSDAQELEKLIEEASEELEILMRAL